MVPYALLRNIESQAVQSLFQRLQGGEFQAFTSVLTFDELSYRLLLALVRDNYPGNPLDQLRHNEKQLIAAFSPKIAAQLQQLQTFPNLTLLELTASDISQMNQLMPRHLLRPRDALHLAAMYKCNCFNMVSEDADFDHVPYLQRFTLAG